MLHTLSTLLRTAALDDNPPAAPLAESLTGLPYHVTGPLSLMPAPGTGFLTLYAPDGPVDVELGFGVGAMQFRCDCRVEADVRSLHRWPERPPEGMDGGGH